jgi:hypothetical protein
VILANLLDLGTKPLYSATSRMSSLRLAQATRISLCILCMTLRMVSPTNRKLSAIVPMPSRKWNDKPTDPLCFELQQGLTASHVDSN